MNWINEPTRNMTFRRGASWCPCMGAKCKGNNPPFCAIKAGNCKKLTACGVRVSM